MISDILMPQHDPGLDVEIGARKGKKLFSTRDVCVGETEIALVANKKLKASRKNRSDLVAPE